LPPGIAILPSDVASSRSLSPNHLFAIKVIAQAKIGKEHEINVWPSKMGQKIG